ncbi:MULTISPECIES: hypothetical protein [unclassified Novosphingobium]|uniref:hypothetical protein n=1 Tax=unclassified Novosphingobium TaxID=2644732 RepID=UPI000B25E471|nr:MULTISPECIES: hypothetical protein [unclassified Novosphingobium]MBN9142672.1 hypothetical protein [Novosphingobium sp.]MDR6705756.1 hypothetical protein [Novosphingobium sp. 1748]
MICLPTMKHRCKSQALEVAALACGILMTGFSAPARADEGPVPAEAKEREAIVIGTDLYPAISRQTNQQRFDRSSNLLVNTIGARTGLFGAASREGETWANRYVPGTDLSGIVQLYSLSTTGNYGAFFGARSSDNRSARAENVIGSINLVVADSDRPHLHWAQYSEGYVPRGKTAFRLLINDENSIQNEGNPAPFADPYNFNPQQLLNNLRVDCGIGMGEPQSCTNPISILNNGASYRLGILFGDKSIEVVDGAADAVALPAQYALSWYGAPGRPSWRVFSTARRAGAGKLIMADDAVLIEVGPAGGTPALKVERDAISAPATIASGGPPSISGSCAVGDRRGGQAAGSFAMARDCAAGTVMIGFSAEAPNGWACFASSLTRSEGILRETAYDRKSATFAVSNMRQSDSVVFSCNGF